MRYKFLSGEHYPTDLAAGLLLGEAVARELLENPMVQKFLDEIRHEIATNQPH